MSSFGEKSSQYTKRFNAGTLLFEENDPGHNMYVIQDGHVKIFRTVGQTEIVLALLGQGEFFGEMALLESQPRSASAEVVDDAVLIEMDQETFEDVIRNNSEIAIRIMRKLSARVREADQRIQNLMMESALGRTLEVFRAMVPSGKKEGNQYIIEPSAAVTIQQRAGLTMPTMESIYVRLEAAGVITRQNDGSIRAENMDTFNDYNEYLDLKHKFDPLTAAELAHISGLTEEEVHKVMQRILNTHIEDDSIKDNPDLMTYKRYLQLKRKFEYATPAI